MIFGDSNFSDWIRCPECGFDDFGSGDIPQLKPGKNTFIECPDCGEEGVRSG